MLQTRDERLSYLKNKDGGVQQLGSNNRRLGIRVEATKQEKRVQLGLDIYNSSPR